MPGIPSKDKEDRENTTLNDKSAPAPRINSTTKMANKPEDPAPAPQKSTTALLKAKLHRSQKSTNEFTRKRALWDFEATGKKSHSVEITIKSKYNNGDPSGKNPDIWFRKPEPNKVIAHTEVVAQELMRLFIENHPKTRINIGDDGLTYVNSKEVENLTPLELMSTNNLCDMLSSGKLTGMGKVVMMALWIDETDLKLGNLVADSNNEVVKFDGDWCLSGGMRDPNRTCKLTSETLNNLPVNTETEAVNWLDTKKRWKIKS